MYLKDSAEIQQIVNNYCRFNPEYVAGVFCQCNKLANIYTLTTNEQGDDIVYGYCEKCVSRANCLTCASCAKQTSLKNSWLLSMVTMTFIGKTNGKRWNFMATTCSTKCASVYRRQFLGQFSAKLKRMVISTHCDFCNNKIIVKNSKKCEKVLGCEHIYCSKICRDTLMRF
jgi:hypothetical protein